MITNAPVTLATKISILLPDKMQVLVTNGLEVTPVIHAKYRGGWEEGGWTPALRFYFGRLESAKGH